ncbi:MAG: hypothetical protein GC181_04875 [Bacteroidetes bacterium]|nr:hypothetical protein [Bacteroidota bacterium]
MRTFLLWLFFILIAFSLLFFVAVINIDYSTGVRSGTLMKISEKGVLFKTWEGQLNTGGFTEDNGDITSSIWHFSIRKSQPEILKEIEKAIDDGHRVKLYYHEKYVHLFFLGDTKYFVYKVEKVGAK